MKKVLYIAVILLLACGNESSGPFEVREVVSVECNDGTVYYVYREDCSSVTCEGHGGVKQGCR